jgi:hypothetical protein
MGIPIAIFYHCILSSKERPIDPDYALSLIEVQMHALQQSGLADAASSIFVGVNGSDSDALAVACLCPPKATIICHGQGAITEIPTMTALRKWAIEHPGFYLFYHHTKGVSTPNQADGWRRRMEHHNVWRWRDCVLALDKGHDACGCHWLTPEQNPECIKTPMFGGTFWWAKTEYIATLPPLPEPIWQLRYEAESWIGRGPRRPKVKDFSPGWPTPYD